MIRCKLIMEKSKENNKEKRMVDQPSVVKFLAPLVVICCSLFAVHYSIALFFRREEILYTVIYSDKYKPGNLVSSQSLYRQGLFPLVKHHQHRLSSRKCLLQ